MANGGDGPRNGGARIPPWLPLVLAAGIPLVGAWIAVTRLAEQNSTQIAELDRRVTLIELNRTMLVPEMYDRIARLEEQQRQHWQQPPARDR